MDSVDRTADKPAQAAHPGAGYGRVLERTGFAVVDLGDITTLANRRAALRHCIAQVARGGAGDRACLTRPAPGPRGDG